MAPPQTFWFYNSDTGGVDELPAAVGEVLLHSGFGWHGPFTSKQMALDYYTNNKAANPGWKAPTGLLGNVENLPSAATTQVSNVTEAITAAINTAVKLIPRILEATLGIALLAIAANVILKQTTGVDVAGTAAKAGKKLGKTAATAAVL